MPLFKGYYYVRRPDEIRLGEAPEPLELFALAAEAKGIGSWYFGLHTALRLNGMTHEDRREETVVSDRFYRIRGYPSAPDGSSSTSGRLSCSRSGSSNRSRKKGWAETHAWSEHLDALNASRLRRHVVHYPAEVRAAVEKAL